jgi:hypothetical protein
MNASRYAGDKYPDYWFSIDSLAKHPHLIAIVIIRDPRDVVSSTLIKARGAWRNSWPAEMRDAEAVARRWVQMVDAVRRNLTRILVVHYEAFTADPGRVLPDVATALALDPSGFDASSVHRKSVGKYREKLSAAELREVLAVAGEHMRELGYDLDEPGLRDEPL